MTTKRLTLVVARHWLILLAGTIWTAVGLMLLWRAYGWLMAMDPTQATSIGMAGMVMGGTVYRIHFAQLARKNLRRLSQLPEKVSIFAVNSRQGYVIVVFMVGLGIALRRSSIPRSYLALVYTTMGGTLFLASLHFHRRFWHLLQRQRHQKDV